MADVSDFRICVPVLIAMDGTFDEWTEILGLGGERARECLYIEMN
jgi:hypothetical protein